MKSKIIFGLLAFVLVIFIILLYIPENKSFKIISSPKIHSIYKSSDNESFEVEFLVNKIDTYYFDDEYISNISINSELDEEIVPLIINNISYSTNLYLYNNEEYYLVELSLAIGFSSSNYLIEYEKAYLDIKYNNEEALKLFIGEFNYLFNNEINSDISLNNLSSTVFKINDVSTVSGVYIELNNTSDENLVISNFSIGSSSLAFNNYFLSELYNEPDLFMSVEDILLTDEFNYELFTNEVNQNILLRENQSIMLYVPISYLGNIDYIHRFYFEIEYISNQGSGILVIDDFPYISTSVFQESLEDGYIVYELSN